MKATNLSPAIWNAIADLANRQASPREIYFLKVRKRDNDQKLVWCEQYGNFAIPVIGFDYRITYFDTQPDGTVLKKHAITDVIVPSINDIVAILDVWGAQRFPMCIGTILSHSKFWEAGKPSGEESD